jgi:hypothetical protein
VLDSSGVPVGETRCYPFGETRLASGSIFTDRLFTGQKMAGLGLYYYNARFYSRYPQFEVYLTFLGRHIMIN